MESPASGWGFEHGNQTSGSVEGREFVCQLSDCEFLQDSVSSTELLLIGVRVFSVWDTV
jgi:hypothetical protein